MSTGIASSAGLSDGGATPHIAANPVLVSGSGQPQALAVASPSANGWTLPVLGRSSSGGDGTGQEDTAETAECITRVGPDGETFYEDSQHNRVPPPPPDPPDAGQFDFMLAAVLRTASLWPLFVVGEDPRKNGSALRGATGILGGEHSATAYIWRAAGLAYREHGRVPDRATLHAAAVAEMRQSLVGMPLAFEASKVAELASTLDACYGPQFDDVDIEQARPRVLATLTELLYSRQIQRVVLAGGRGLPDAGALARVEEIKQELLACATGAENDGPFTTTEFRQQVQNRVEIVQGVLVEQQLAILGGPTKSLKTLVSLDLAISIATGTHFLGHAGWAADRPRRVGFYSGESGAGTLLRKHDVISATKQAMLPAEERAAFQERLAANLAWKTRLPDVGDKAAVRRMQAEIRQRQLEVLFLDPLLLCMGTAAKDMANAALTGHAMMELNRAVLAENCTLVLVHHPSGDRARQMSARACRPLELTDLAYPGITNFVRQWTTINRSADYDPVNRCNNLWLNIGGSGLQAGGIFHTTITEGLTHDRWDVHIESEAAHLETAGAQRAAETHHQEREETSRVLEYLRRHPEGSSVREMSRDAVMLAGLGEAKISRALRALSGHPGVVRSAQGRNTTLWFAMPPELPSAAGWTQPNVSVADSEQEEGDSPDVESDNDQG